MLWGWLWKLSPVQTGNKTKPTQPPWNYINCTTLNNLSQEQAMALYPGFWRRYSMQDISSGGAQSDLHFALGKY